MVDFNLKRVYKLNNKAYKRGPVVYWMSRDQRVFDNWALIYAQQKAMEYKTELKIIFVLVPEFLEATIRHYGFMLKGMQELERDLKTLNIPFEILLGQPEEQIRNYIEHNKAGELITDFDPLKIKRVWKEKLIKELQVPFYEVDAHNIVPCREASPKQEYGAYTLRPKINKQLPEYLTEYPEVIRHPFNKSSQTLIIDWVSLKQSLKVNTSVAEVSWLKPGTNAAISVLDVFINQKLSHYSAQSNDPTLDMISHMSPYIHFGQISAQRVALEICKTNTHQESKDAYLEQLIVRRELADNFCFYSQDYESLKYIPDWAKATLEEHKADLRTYLYTPDQLEQATTHDELWNAAQIEMVKTGKMHNYMRMYWAKKILEWTESPEIAVKTAIYLNDKYELDGRDPNGYTGIMWSIGGIHDRAWKERPVFGKIRYMSYNGCKSKFKIKNYIDKVINL